MTITDTQLGISDFTILNNLFSAFNEHFYLFLNLLPKNGHANYLANCLYN